MAAPSITLSDDPSFPGTLPRAFDADGVPKAPIALIEDGVARAVVHDRRSAALAGGDAVSTGHAARARRRARAARTRRTSCSPAAARRRSTELCAPIERGLYVTRLWYVNVVDGRRTLLTGMTRDGTFLIEDGPLARPVRDVRFTDSVLRLLSATEALTASARLVSETNFYGRRFATGVVCPALRASGFRVTGQTV